MLRRTFTTLAAAALAAGALTVPIGAQELPDDTLTGCPEGAASAPFDDVSETSTHAEAIDCAVERDVVRGVTDDTFAPADPASRGQLAALLARALRSSGIQLPDAEVPPFEDAVGTTHAADIAAMAAAGVIEGYDDGTVRPQTAVTRAQVASLVTRAHRFALGLPTATAGGPYFDDYTEGTHAAAVDLAFELGLVQGRTADTFDPASQVRRDQFASIVDRLLGAMDAFPAPDFDLTVLHSNDGESMLVPDEDAGFPGVARFVADMQSMQAQAVDAGADSGVVTISSGDNFLAGPRLNASRLVDDAPFYDALVYNEANYDAMTIGNHEFDFSPDLLAEFIAAVDADIPFLSANIDVSPEPVLDALGDRIAPSTIIEEAGRRIGVIGAVYEDLESVSSPRDVVINEVLPAVEAQIAELQSQDVDIILLSSHLQDLNTELTLIPELSGVDAVVGGGGGEDLRATYPLFAVDADGQQVPVVTTPGNYTDIGRLVLGFDADGALVRITSAASQLMPVAMDGPRNQTMTTEVETPVEAYVESLSENALAQTEVPLDGRRGFVRTRETNLGSMLADAMLLAARDRAVDIPDAPQADVALSNGGGIRNDSIIGPGAVTELDTFNVAAFLNFVSVATIDGDTLVAVMEHALESAPEPAGGFGQWAGVDFTYDLEQPAGARLVDVTVTREDDSEVLLVDDGATTAAGSEEFAIASVNFLLDGGDDFPFPEDLEYNQMPVTYQEALAERVADLGTITAEDYPDLTVDEDRYDRFGPVGGEFIN